MEKLHYLKAAVQGKARAALDVITITEANYALAWKLLVDRYDNPQLLAQQHMLALSSIKPMKEESSSGLQGLHDQVMRYYETLRALK